MDKTLDTLRRLREARQRSALALARRQDSLVAQSRSTLHTAQALLDAQVAAKGAVGGRVAAALANQGSARDLVEAAHENSLYRQRIDGARLEVADARIEHERATQHLRGLHQALRHADANCEKIRVAGERAELGQARRSERREQELLDETALRRRERPLADPAGDPMRAWTEEFEPGAPD